MCVLALYGPYNRYLYTGVSYYIAMLAAIVYNIVYSSTVETCILHGVVLRAVRLTYVEPVCGYAVESCMRLSEYCLQDCRRA